MSLIFVANSIAELAAEIREMNENLARIAAAQERAADGGAKPGSERSCEVEGDASRR